MRILIVGTVVMVVFVCLVGMACEAAFKRTVYTEPQISKYEYEVTIIIANSEPVIFKLYSDYLYKDVKELLAKVSTINENTMEIRINDRKLSINEKYVVKREMKYKELEPYVSHEPKE